MKEKPLEEILLIFGVLDRQVKHKQITVKEACEILGISTGRFYRIRQKIEIEELKNRIEDLEN